MNAPLAGALILFAGWIAAFVVMARRAQRRRPVAEQAPTDAAQGIVQPTATDQP